MSVSMVLARVENYNPNMARMLRKKRKQYDLLMEIPRNTMREIQFRAILANYLQGSGRCYDRDTQKFSSLNKKQ